MSISSFRSFFRQILIAPVFRKIIPIAQSNPKPYLKLAMPRYRQLKYRLKSPPCQNELQMLATINFQTN